MSLARLRAVPMKPTTNSDVTNMRSFSLTPQFTFVHDLLIALSHVDVRALTVNLLGITMLALAFVMLIGFALVAEGMEFHVPKGYLYFAMAFSVLVESLNVVVARRRRAGRDERQ